MFNIKLALLILQYGEITILNRFLKLLITSAIYVQKLKQALVEFYSDGLFIFSIDHCGWIGQKS